MGWINSAVSAVTKVVDTVTTSVAGAVNEACQRIGLPPALANIVSMAFDPLHAGENLHKLIDDTCGALGVPDNIRDGLKRVVDKAQKIAQTAATQGVGGVIREIGAELGVPPGLCAAIALAADAATGNAAAVTQSAVALAAEAADAMGLPKGITNFAELGASIAAGNPEGIRKGIADVAVTVADGLDMPQEFKDLAHMGAAFAKGDTQAVTQASMQLGAHVGSRLGLPAEAAGVLNAGVALARGDNEALKAAGKQLANELIDELPAEIQGPLRKGVEAFAKDPKAALETIKNLPELGKSTFEALTNATKDPETLKKLAAEGVKYLPAEAQGPVLFLAQRYIDEPKQALVDLQGLPDMVQTAFKKALDQATDPDVLKRSVKTLYEEGKSRLNDEGKLALQIGEHIAADDRDALKADLKKFTNDKIKSLSPQAQETVKVLQDLVNGDTSSLKKEIDEAKAHAKQKLAEEIYVPLRV
jgi:hypothetical protein